ncbi:MAG: hypothetical protein QXO71_02480 [Candidatus Jordarchaeaceae archaeon]
MGRDKKSDNKRNKKNKKATHIEKIVKIFGSRKIFRRIGKRLVSRDLKLSIEHFFKEGQLTAEDVASGALGFGLTVSIITLLVGSMINILISLMLSIAMFVFVVNYMITYFPKKYNKTRWTIARYADFILEELLFTLSTKGSIFDFILLIANANYPIISQEFKSLANQVNFGEKPEKLLIKFAHNQPTETLKIYIPAILKASEISDNLVDRTVKIAQREVRNEYQKQTLELEGRLLIVMGIGFFIPIVISLGLLLRNMGTNPLFLALIPLQIIILVILENFTIQSKTNLLETSKLKNKHTSLVSNNK